MKSITFCLCSFLFLTTIHAEKVADLPEVLEPGTVHVIQKGIYICEGKTIHIYSLGNFKHQKQFGRIGEGPGEFRFLATLDVYPSRLVVNTVGKLIFYSLNGDLLEEFKFPDFRIREVHPLGNRFVGTEAVTENDRVVPLQRISIYDRDFKPLKQIFQGSLGRTMFVRSDAKKKQDNSMVRDYVDYRVYGDRIYLGNTIRGFHCEIYDAEGIKIHEINREYTRLAVTKEYKETRMAELRDSPHWERYEKRYNFIFPDYFPAYRDMRISDDMIYFITHAKSEGRPEVVVTDLRGNFLKKTYLPPPPEGQPFLFAISGNRVYHLVENPENETFELHMENLN